MIPDTNKIPKHLFQGYLNIYNNYFNAPWMPDRTEANTNELNRDDACFFSSRRRHTRLQGDWSSDVCSSDLDRLEIVPGREMPQQRLGVDAGEFFLADRERHGGNLGGLDALVAELLVERHVRVAEIGRASCRERV